METTDEADPTITRPKRQSNETMIKSRVAVGSCWTVAMKPDRTRFVVMRTSLGS